MSGERYIFFDLDGPILDVSEKYYRLYADLVSERGGLPIPKADYWNCKRQRVADEVILKLSGIEGWTPDYQNLRRERIETQNYLHYDRVWPGIPQMLSDLASQFSVVLVTLRNSPEALRWELEAFGLLSLFHHVLSASGDGARGEKAGVKVALVRNTLGFHAFSGWFVGDTETDVRAGQILGVKTAAVTFGIRTAEHLASLSPDVLIQKPQALVEWAGTYIRQDSSSEEVLKYSENCFTIHT